MTLITSDSRIDKGGVKEDLEKGENSTSHFRLKM
jgi:hypothetical protein